MTVYRMNLPVAINLTKEAEWQEFRSQPYTYFIVRYHLILDDNQSEDKTYDGEIISSYQTTDHSETETFNRIEKEHTRVNIYETVENELLSSESLVQATQSIAAGCKLPVGDLSAEAQLSAYNKMTEAVSVTSREHAAQTVREKTVFEIKQKIFKEESEKVHAVACYKPKALEVYLHYYDYLLVEYKKTTFGLRKKKTNLPRPIGNQHINRVLVNLPLVTIHYWQLLPKSSVLYTESEYPKRAHKIEDPHKVRLEKLEKELSLLLPNRLEKPTLYTLSNIAFPLKWIHREGPWTQEELENIELEEAVGSAWWFQYGPGRN